MVLGTLAWSDIEISMAILAVVIGLTIYAASSDLFKLNLLRLNPQALRFPRKLKIDYWYIKLSRRFSNFLIHGSWHYASVKKRVRDSLKKGARSIKTDITEKIPAFSRELRYDGALGPLAIAACLSILLFIRIV